VGFSGSPSSIRVSLSIGNAATVIFNSFTVTESALVFGSFTFSDFNQPVLLYLDPGTFPSASVDGTNVNSATVVVMVVPMKMMPACRALILGLMANASSGSSNRSDCEDEQEQKDKGFHGPELLKP
jgi:hypothetical protein